MTEFFIDGKRKEIEEPWVVFSVYGDFLEPSFKQHMIIVRMPSGRVPWTKKIAPAINRLVKQWGFPGDRAVYWNVDGEHTIFVGKNFYHGTDEPIPESKRLWDCISFAHYEWDGEKLIKESTQKGVIP
jgi:hypothetical protein